MHAWTPSDVGVHCSVESTPAPSGGALGNFTSPPDLTEGVALCTGYSEKVIITAALILSSVLQCPVGGRPRYVITVHAICQLTSTRFPSILFCNAGFLCAL